MVGPTEQQNEQMANMAALLCPDCKGAQFLLLSTTDTNEEKTRVKLTFAACVKCKALILLTEEKI